MLGDRRHHPFKWTRPASLSVNPADLWFLVRASSLTVKINNSINGPVPNQGCKLLIHKNYQLRSRQDGVLQTFAYELAARKRPSLELQVIG